MKYLYCSSIRHFLTCLVLITALLSSACDRQTAAPSTDPMPGKVRTFTGTWTATGDRQTILLGGDHKAVIFRLTGSLLLSGKQRLKKGFMADLVGFSDNQSGMLGRSVWTDENGDKVFSNVQSEATTPGRMITGNFFGGTGRYSNISGEYTFRWRRMIDNENGKTSGRTVDLKGWARLGSPETIPGTKGGPQ